MEVVQLDVTFRPADPSQPATVQRVIKNGAKAATGRWLHACCLLGSLLPLITYCSVTQLSSDLKPLKRQTLPPGWMTAGG